MSFTYPEWVIPESANRAALLQECESALAAYQNQKFKLGLCMFTLQMGMGHLHHTLRVTLKPNWNLSLESYIEVRDGLPPYLLDRNLSALAKRRVEWLNQLKEKIDGTE